MYRYFSIFALNLLLSSVIVELVYFTIRVIIMKLRELINNNVRSYSLIMTEIDDHIFKDINLLNITICIIFLVHRCYMFYISSIKCHSQVEKGEKPNFKVLNIYINNN